MEGFSLHKAYLDVVDAAGRCAIVYRATLAWGPLALRWDGLSLFEPGEPPVHRSSWRAIRASRGDSSAHAGQKPGGNICDATYDAWCAPFAARLLETPDGMLEWRCDAAGADVAVETKEGTTVRGAGYAEHLELRIPPWQLPIDELRWGRWHCPETQHSVVWIDWRGERPLTIVLENGVARDTASVGDTSIEWGDRTLCLGSAETLYSRTLAEILRGAGPLVTRLPASWRALDDRKTLSRSVLGAESGWAIHETVTFPGGSPQHPVHGRRARSEKTETRRL